MLTVARVGKVMRQVFEQDAPQLAREMGVIQRERKLTGSTLAQLLVLGWLRHPQAGPSALARFAGTLAVTISKQGIEQHWSLLTAEWLYALLLRASGYLVTAKGVAIPLWQRFGGVYLEDGSSIVLPDALARYWRGCGGRQAEDGGRLQAAVKLTVRLEVVHGTLAGPYLQDGRSHESSSLLQQQPLPKGALWIADLGYFALIRLAELSRRGVCFLMPLKDGVMTWLAGRQVDVLGLLAQQKAQEQEYQIELGAGRQVRCRLLARRASPAQIQRRHRQQDEYARKHGTQGSARQRDWACWQLLITTVPAGRLSLAEAFVLLRCRWQIELLWKLWKMQGVLDEWQTQNVARILCEVYAKLLGLLLQHWLLLLSCWDDPHRSWSGVAELVREQVVVLAHGCAGRLPLKQALRLVQAALREAAGRSVAGRTDRPSTSRLLLAVSDDGLT